MRRLKKKFKSKKELKQLYKRKFLKRIIFAIFFINTMALVIFIIFIFIKRNNNNHTLNISNKNFLNEELKKISKKINDWNGNYDSNIIESNNETINQSFFKDLSYKEKKKKITEEMPLIKKFINIVVAGTITNFNKCDDPKISIVVSIYNAEGYLKNTLLSIQKQDFKDIEILLIDDCSKDNSVSLIKELMEKDRRIIFYQNQENRGALYTKSRGILYSKSKYVMTLDEDDMYIQSNALSTIYEEAEKYNLDILGFASLNADLKLSNRMKILRFLQTPIICPPDIYKRMYTYNRKGNVKRVGDVLWNYIFRTDLFQRTIEQIAKNVFDIKMNNYDDFLLFFSITRNAKKFRQIPRIFHLKIEWENNTKIIFQLNEKYKNRDNLNCMAFANYIRFLLMNTNNTIQDKKIASYELNNYFNSKKCSNNIYSKEEIKNICELFLKNEYIEDKMKGKINIYLKEEK